MTREKKDTKGSRLMLISDGFKSHLLFTTVIDVDVFLSVRMQISLIAVIN